MKTALLILAIEIFLPGGTLLALTLAWDLRRKNPRRTKSVRRDEGARRRLHHHQREVPGGSDGVDQALSQPVDRRRRGRNRGAPPFRARGLRRQSRGRALPQDRHWRIAMLKLIGIGAGPG